MNAKFVLVFIGILFVSVLVKSQTTDSPNVSSGPQECGENEEWNQCGTTCPPRCPTRFRPPPIVCTKMCIPSCQCVKGYLRSFDGKCVRPKDCPKITLPMIPGQPQPQLPTPQTM